MFADNNWSPCSLQKNPGSPQSAASKNCNCGWFILLLNSVFFMTRCLRSSINASIETCTLGQKLSFRDRVIASFESEPYKSGKRKTSSLLRIISKFHVISNPKQQNSLLSSRCHSKAFKLVHVYSGKRQWFCSLHWNIDGPEKPKKSLPECFNWISKNFYFGDLFVRHYFHHDLIRKPLTRWISSQQKFIVSLDQLLKLRKTIELVPKLA